MDQNQNLLALKRISISNIESSSSLIVGSEYRLKIILILKIFRYDIAEKQPRIKTHILFKNCKNLLYSMLLQCTLSKLNLEVIRITSMSQKPSLYEAHCLY